MQVKTCPVCTGNGIVDEGFYRRTSDTWTSCGGSEKCRSCNGRGYVIIPEEEFKKNTLPYWAEWRSKCCGAKMAKCKDRNLRFLFYRCTNCDEVCELKEYK